MNELNLDDILHTGIVIGVDKYLQQLNLYHLTREASSYLVLDDSS